MEVLAVEEFAYPLEVDGDGWLEVGFHVLEVRLGTPLIKLIWWSTKAEAGTLASRALQL